MFTSKLSVLAEPERPLVPDHPPDALQEVVFVLLQVSVETPPEVTVLGLADSNTVGGDGGDGVTAWVVALADAD